MKKLIISLCALCLTTVLSANVYLIGDACAAGWNPANALSMTFNDGNYTWNGRLTTGELKFIANIGEWMPCYNATENAQFFSFDTPMEIVYNTDGANDFKFFVFEGDYSLTLNTDDNTLIVSGTQLPIEYDKTSLMIVGDATPNGWTATNMTSDGNNIFSYTGDFSAEGGFKFRWSDDWWPALVAPQPNHILTCDKDERVDYMPGDKRDYTFKVPSSSNYTVTVNLDNLSLKIVDNKAATTINNTIIGNDVKLKIENQNIQIIDSDIISAQLYRIDGTLSAVLGEDSSINNVSPGVYIIRMTDKKDTIISQKVIIK